jgi:hypothetical protein
MNKVTSHRCSHQQEGLNLLSLAKERSFVVFNKRSVVFSSLEDRVVEDSFEETKVVVGAYHSVIFEGLLHDPDGLISV